MTQNIVQRLYSLGSELSISDVSFEVGKYWKLKFVPPGPSQTLALLLGDQINITVLISTSGEFYIVSFVYTQTTMFYSERISETLKLYFEAI